MTARDGEVDEDEAEAGERWLIGQTRELWDYEVEDAVIASCLVHADAVEAVVETGVKPDDFFGRQGALTFAAILRVRDRWGSEAVNQVTVAHDLACRKVEHVNQLEAVGGNARLSSMVAALPTWVGCEWYARIVMRCAHARRVKAAADAVAGMDYTAPDAAEKAAAVFGALSGTTGVVGVPKGRQPAEDDFYCHRCGYAAVAYNELGQPSCGIHAPDGAWA